MQSYRALEGQFQNHNFSGATPIRYERQVSEVRIKRADLPLFLRFAEEQGQYLIDAVDDWLERRAAPNDGNNDYISVGLGAYSWVRSTMPDTKTRRASSKSSPLRKPRPRQA